VTQHKLGSFFISAKTLCTPIVELLSDNGSFNGINMESRGLVSIGPLAFAIMAVMPLLPPQVGLSEIRNWLAMMNLGVTNLPMKNLPRRRES
jgi:hypothetical protein